LAQTPRKPSASHFGTEEPEALAEQPEALDHSPASLTVLAMALKGNGLTREAGDLLRRAQRRNPGDFWLNYFLGQFLEPAPAGEAVSFLRAALAIRPGSKAAHNALGVALADQGRLDDAIAHYRRAIELAPAEALPYKNLGNALRRAGGHRSEALQAYRKAVALQPGYAYAHNGLGNALKEEGDLDAAVAAYRKAIEIDPKYARPHFGVGVALYERGDRDGALAEY
jgi:Flp pilus assembly protein TadD